MTDAEITVAQPAANADLTGDTNANQTDVTPASDGASSVAAGESQATPESQLAIEPVPPVVADPIITAETAVEAVAVDEKKGVENAGHAEVHSAWAKIKAFLANLTDDAESEIKTIEKHLGL